MVRSKAASVQAYLESLTPEQRQAVSTVREVVLEHLPDGYTEFMKRGMIKSLDARRK